jgi:triosephosphate isomerase
MSKNNRQPLISGNWKMHQNHFEAIQCLQKLAYLVGKDDFDAVDVSIHPPFTDIRSVQTLIEGDGLRFSLGAQHCHYEEKGAYTGEIAPGFLAKLNVRFVICGHSERREIFGETNEIVHKKLLAILANKMTPILCVGETLEEREAGNTFEKVLGQLRDGLASLSPEQAASVVIAYEPIWAIGTGKTATSEDAQEVCSAIRREIGVLFGADTALTLRSLPRTTTEAAQGSDVCG